MSIRETERASEPCGGLSGDQTEAEVLPRQHWGSVPVRHGANVAAVWQRGRGQRRKPTGWMLEVGGSGRKESGLTSRFMGTSEW